MSVQSEVDRIITAVGNAYSKVSEKGGTVPASQTVANLATAIDSIPAGGGAPSLQSKSVTYTSHGTNTITPAAEYDGLSSVDVTVNVSGGGGGVETCTVTIIYRGPINSRSLRYTNGNMTITTGTLTTGGKSSKGTFKVAKGTVLFTEFSGSLVNVKGEIEQLNFNTYAINGDGTIEMST